MTMPFSRRNLLLALAASGTAPLASSLTGPRPARAAIPAMSRTLCYIGGYNKHAPPGGAGNGQGIAIFEMNRVTGGLIPVSTFMDIASPSFITMSADSRFLYALSEIDDFNADHDGSVTAFSVDRTSGELNRLNVVSSGGAVPAHLSVHRAGHHVLVANYVGGSVGVLPIRPDGSLGEPTDVVHNTGPHMPERAEDNPPGNFAISDHSGSHVHMVASDPSGRFVVACDAGLDRVYVWTLDLASGKLRPAATPFINLIPGSAPRHFAFSKDGRTIYILCEQDSKVVVASFDPRTGALVPQQKVSTVTSYFQGSTLAAEILISPNGRYVYASNRLGDSLAIFRVGPDGSLTLIDEVWMHADYGRAMVFDPSGTFLYCANQRSDSVTSFRVNPETGALDFNWHFTAIGSPTTFAFLQI
ncbi:putative 6-phosphogluconolactonase [Gluconacetobacter diazotrophicus PA1 5]|uniref:Putative 6-phosphogluconolactonase n=1 Tax=Gluconacetobacter diazotrophicus (strain ATCC 49037 / DSM 5601 / CCUG 37298 / CIP 103539 / LMG 7603 / PAl5) TaxID=272568 RepID=A9HJ42_GLUDA|nr:lactonase family protein [Gluconacetobacter diazotrophicus]ACI49930.1 putative 6-phosphogluconolactonase [Gluconacetobacter diazotrophicus PA1 5]TWB05974.1 6-phosphogluconolactonase (cycloisomerase 2 family) [Gluconacetobacter diazotrophicus]CAP55850.1 putative 6-phosphogluconolactonase [Gluconacetobacter diazotrophicus PA1 5]